MNPADLPVFLLIILFTHWVGDFVLQSHRVAVLKSKHFSALIEHVAIYTSAMTAGTSIALVFLLPNLTNFETLATFFVWTFALHCTQDAITSRMTSRLWADQRWHDFFVLVGFDQLLHYIALGFTLYGLGIIH